MTQCFGHSSPHGCLRTSIADYSFPMVSCRSKADKFNGIDTREVVRAINKDAGVLESFKEGEEPYAIHPPRLMSSPIL